MGVAAPMSGISHDAGAVRGAAVGRRTARAGGLAGDSGGIGGAVRPAKLRAAVAKYGFAPRRGEVWWVETPGRPADPHQPRPAVVIADDGRNEAFDHVLVVPIYHAGRAGPTHIPVAAGTGGRGGLPYDSLACCEEVSNIDHVLLDWERGPASRRVPADLLDAIVRGIRRAVGDTVVPPAGRVAGW